MSVCTSKTAENQQAQRIPVTARSVVNHGEIPTYLTSPSPSSLSRGCSTRPREWQMSAVCEAAMRWLDLLDALLAKSLPNLGQWRWLPGGSPCPQGLLLWRYEIAAAYSVDLQSDRRPVCCGRLHVSRCPWMFVSAIYSGHTKYPGRWMHLACDVYTTR